MKKLKIFLMLSILLCFGFTLSTEVHAQGDGPKLFEVGEVLPATSQLRIHFNSTGNSGVEIALGLDLKSDNNNYQFIVENGDYFSFNSSPLINIYNQEEFYFVSPFTGSDSNHNYIDIDISSWSLSKRTITNVGDCPFTWEDLTPIPSSAKIFEVGDVLPQGIIRVSWDETEWFRMAYVLGDPGGNQILSNNNSYDLLDYIYPQVLTYPEPGLLELVPPYTVYGGGHAYIDIDTLEWDLGKRTISTVFWREELTSRLYWEDITPDGYTQGYLEAREKFGYYDSNTDEWLSVTEYLNRYGTDKPGQSDFYNNFDKYFIPAMIIVFGGAIVLTILKVFKGRE